MDRDWFYAKARKYPTSLAGALDAENLPDSVYDNLIPLLMHFVLMSVSRVKKPDLLSGFSFCTDSSP